jgi:hypothetical protein
VKLKRNYNKIIKSLQCLVLTKICCGWSSKVYVHHWRYVNSSLSLKNRLYIANKTVVWSPIFTKDMLHSHQLSLNLRHRFQSSLSTTFSTFPRQRKISLVRGCCILHGNT